jgi:uncharacterized protein DUF6496
MPEKTTMRAARRDARRGRSASTQAGEFVREEMHHIRSGKHGARSTKQAIAIGLSKARRAGVRLPAPRKGTASAQTRTKARRDIARGKRTKRPSRARSRAVSRALRREPHRAASRDALARQARTTARRRGHRRLAAAARQAVRTKGRRARVASARKAAHTRRMRGRRRD